MFEKNLYTLCALLSLSCSAYAMEGEIDKDDSAASSSVIALASSSASLSDQGLDATEANVSPSTSSTQNLLFPGKGKVTFNYLDLLQAADDFQEPRACNLLEYLCYLGEVNYLDWNPHLDYSLPLLQEELDGSLRQKYPQHSDIAIKIATIGGAFPTTKKAITRLSNALGSPQKLPSTSKWPSSHKQREVQLRNLALEAAHRLEAATQEKEVLFSELERLKAALEEQRAVSQRLRSDFTGVADRYGFKLRL